MLITTSITLLRDDDQTKIELDLHGRFSKDSAGYWLEDWGTDPLKFPLSEKESEMCVSALYQEV